jgi:hypothetical protein
MKITKTELLEMIDRTVFNIVTERFNLLDEDYQGFDKLSKKLGSKGAKNPKALAAWIGRNKYGKGKFQKAAASGKKMGKK